MKSWEIQILAKAYVPFEMVVAICRWSLECMKTPTAKPCRALPPLYGFAFNSNETVCIFRSVNSDDNRIGLILCFNDNGFTFYSNAINDSVCCYHLYAMPIRVVPFVRLFVCSFVGLIFWSCILKQQNYK